MHKLIKMFLNLDDFGKCSPVSRIPRIPAFGRLGFSRKALGMQRYNFVDI
jgi:hypothetical protein